MTWATVSCGLITCRQRSSTALVLEPWLPPTTCMLMYGSASKPVFWGRPLSLAGHSGAPLRFWRCGSHADRQALGGGPRFRQEGKCTCFDAASLGCVSPGLRRLLWAAHCRVFVMVAVPIQR